MLRKKKIPYSIKLDSLKTMIISMFHTTMFVDYSFRITSLAPNHSLSGAVSTKSALANDSG
jgi:hypothetical protein